MVRGRRVRAVVACNRNEECCSPNPKRKDQKSNIIISGAAQKITDFFSHVEHEERHITATLVVEENGLDDDLDDREKEAFTEILNTTIQAISEQFKSPPTPHRIELHINDEEEQQQQQQQQQVVKDVEQQQTVPQVTTTTQPSAKQPKAKKRLNMINDQKQNKLTEFFPVRRSVRKTNKVVLEEKQRTLEDTLRKGIETGLKIEYFEGKGRGIIACRDFVRGDFVVEYAGDLIDIAEARRRETKYAQDHTTGCYMYYFKHKAVQYCIDATPESTRLGRLVNHSRNGNLVTRIVDVDRKPRLVLVAKETICTGEELTYDYGDRSKESLRYHPWLAY